MARTRPPVSFLARCRAVLTLGLCLLLMVAGAGGLLIVGLLTLFQARELYAWLVKHLARLGFWLYGVRIIEHGREHLPGKQTVFISNHTSMLDVFVLPALGLPRARVFLSGFLRPLVPLSFLAWMVGTFWTPSQKHPDRRRRLFRHADDVLRRTGDSVYLTPEGQICGVFNKGAFHLATSLGAPIVPFFIAIRPDVDPGPFSELFSFEVRPGTVHVYYRPPVDTSAWRIEDVAQHRDEFREFYAAWARELEATGQPAPGS